MKRCKCGKEIGIKRSLCVSCENKIKYEYTYQVQYRYKDKKYSSYYEFFSSVEECKKYIEGLDKNKYSLIGIKRSLCVSCENKIKDEYTYQVQYRYKDKKYSSYYESFSSVEECKKYIEGLDKNKYSLIRIVKVDLL